MRNPSSPGVRYHRMHIWFAVASAPVTLGSGVVRILGVIHVISYWWLALTLGWVIVPAVLLFRMVRYGRRLDAARHAEEHAAEPANWRAAGARRALCRFPAGTWAAAAGKCVSRR